MTDTIYLKGECIQVSPLPLLMQAMAAEWVNLSSSAGLIPWSGTAQGRHTELRSRAWHKTTALFPMIYFITWREIQQNTYSCCKSVNTSIIKKQLKLRLVPVSWSYEQSYFTFCNCWIQTAIHLNAAFHYSSLCHSQNGKHFWWKPHTSVTVLQLIDGHRLNLYFKLSKLHVSSQ